MKTFNNSNDMKINQSSNNHQSSRRFTMKNSQLLSRLSRSVVLATLLMSIFATDAFTASRIRNNGTILNNTGSATNCKGFDKGKSSIGGKVFNAGTITISNNAGFFNYDSVNAAGPGTFRNVYKAGGGSGIGVINGAVTFDNGSGTFVNDSIAGSSGTVQVAGTFTNTTPANFTSLLGTVIYNGAGAQAISNSVNSTTIGSLSTATGGTKTLGGNLTVATALTVGASTTMDESGKTLTLNGTVTNSGTFTATGVGSTTIYNGPGLQSVMGASYYNLTIQNTSTKTAAAPVTVVNGGNLTVAGSTIFDLGANALTLQMALTNAVSNSGTIQTAAVGTAMSVGAVYQIGGTFIYNAAAGSQTVAAVNYNNLTYVNAGATRAITGTVGIAGAFTVVGTRTYAGSTVNYNGSAAFGSLAQNIIGGEGYVNLGVSGGAAQADTATHKTVTTGNLTLGAGVLTIAANTNLDMQTFTGSWGATSTLPSTAKIMWQGSNAFVSGAGVTEFYGNGATTVATGATYGNILFTGAGAMTINSAVTATGGDPNVGVTVSSNLTVTGATLTVTGMDFVNGGVVTNGGTITVN